MDKYNFRDYENPYEKPEIEEEPQEDYTETTEPREDTYPYRRETVYGGDEYGGGYGGYGGYNNYGGHRYNRPAPPLSPDINNDGVISPVEEKIVKTKYETQRRMAWVSLISMVIFTLILFSPIIAESRVNALADILGLFYIAQAGIVGSYMGFSSWIQYRKM